MENKIRCEQKIQTLLSRLPKEVSLYYNNMAPTREASTCFEYVEKIDEMIRRLSKGDPKDFDVRTLDEDTLAAYLRTITIKEVNGEKRETSYSFRRNIWFALRSFMTFLYKKRIIEINPMDFIDIPENRDCVQRVVMTKEDFQNIERYCTNDVEYNKYRKAYMWKVRNKVIMSLLMETGMRETALSEIDINDIDFENKTITVIDKRHKTLKYVISNKLISEIKTWIELRSQVIEDADEIDALFIGSNKKRIDSSTVSDVVKNVTLNSIGACLSPHKIRAGFCTILYNETKDIEFVRDAVGHASIDVTKRYIVKDQPAQKKANELMSSIINEEEIQDEEFKEYMNFTEDEKEITKDDKMAWLDEIEYEKAAEEEDPEEVLECIFEEGDEL